MTVTIAAVNDAPIAGLGLSGITDENISVSIQLSASDVDGDNLTYSLLSDATNGGITIEGQLATPLQQIIITVLMVTFQVSDGELTDNASVSLFVNAVNDAPVLATLDNMSFDEDSSGGVTLSATDIDGDDSHTVLQQEQILLQL